MLIFNENFRWHLEAFASELFLASQYITITAIKKKNKKKSGQTIHSCSMRVPYAGL